MLKSGCGRVISNLVSDNNTRVYMDSGSEIQGTLDRFSVLSCTPRSKGQSPSRLVP